MPRLFNSLTQCLVLSLFCGPAVSPLRTRRMQHQPMTYSQRVPPPLALHGYKNPRVSTVTASISGVDFFVWHRLRGFEVPETVLDGIESLPSFGISSSSFDGAFRFASTVSARADRHSSHYSQRGCFHGVSLPKSWNVDEGVSRRLRCYWPRAKN